MLEVAQSEKINKNTDNKVGTEELGSYRNGVESRQRIFNSAKKLFQEKGIEKTTVRDIVADANSKLGLFTYYFTSKDDLTLQVYDELKSNFIKKLYETPICGVMNGDQTVRDMIYYRASFKVIYSNEKITRLWNELVKLKGFGYSNYESRKEDLRRIVLEIGKHSLISDPDFELKLSVLTSISIGSEKQVYGDVEQGKLTFVDAVDELFRYIYGSITLDTDYVEKCIQASKDYVSRLEVIWGDNFDFTLSLK